MARTTTPGSSLVSFGDFTLDLQTGELFSAGSPTVLPHQPFQLLATLIARHGELVTREELRRQLWPSDTFVDFEPGLNAAIRRLRDALGDSAETPRFIETLPRRGYRFIAPVTEGRIASAAPRASPGAAQTADAVHSPQRRRLDLSAVGVLVIIAVIGGVAFVVGSRGPAQDRRGLAGRLTNIGEVRLASLALDGQRLAYVRTDGARESLWLHDGHGDHVQLLPPVDGVFRSVTFGPRDIVYYTLLVPDHTHIALYRVSTRGGAPELLSPASGRISFNRDGSRYASVSTASLGRTDSHVVVDDTAKRTRRIVAVLPPPSHFLNLKPAWSPDGRSLGLMARDDHDRVVLVLIDEASSAERARHLLPFAQVADLLWIADDTFVIAGSKRTGSPQRLWRVSIPAMTLVPLTDDLANYTLAGTATTDTIVAVREENARTVWLTDVAAIDRPRQVVTDSGGYEGFDGLSFASDGRIVYTAMESDNTDVYAIDPRTGERRRLTADPAADFHPDVSPDGQSVAFASERGSVPGVWVMAIDGTHLRRLTSDDDQRPSFSHDGRWLVTHRGLNDNTPATLWRVSVETGEATRFGPSESTRPVFSPDDRLVAHYWMTPERWSVAITPIDGSLPSRTLPIARTHTGRTLRWAPDGRVLAFVDAAGGAANVWLQPLDGSPPRALTHLVEGGLTTFDWSRDGTKLAWSRVTRVGDVVTIPLSRSGS